MHCPVCCDHSFLSLSVWINVDHLYTKDKFLKLLYKCCLHVSCKCIGEMIVSTKWLMGVFFFFFFIVFQYSNLMKYWNTGPIILNSSHAIPDL